VEDRFLNHLISNARVVVENVIAGVKRCRIVKDVLRLTTEGTSDLVMEIACGLHNLRSVVRSEVKRLQDFNKLESRKVPSISTNS
jgi:hypothetical protein